ncbi:alkaline phosphatase [Prolixibacteraceae bacterium Z1-6]|uniref:Alkaline phosphatase n=1 Tax=Draconibacterium aestuarii TaxID=2998507 RepID=A0A9X3FGB7_9BACT|nr:alkaline phosphatase [Prolixibacteraceae bacterium Z1-6]
MKRINFKKMKNVLSLLVGVLTLISVQAQNSDEGNDGRLEHLFRSENTYQVKNIRPTKGEKVDNVILMIGDGMGISHYSSAWIANKGHMNIENCMYAGLVKTYAANKLITDSGAAGTAMATGQKANYHSIAVDVDNNPLNSMTDLANDKGLSTGIIVTCGLTDATPATFCANNPDRDKEEELATDYLNCGVDFILGGGRDKFHNRSDNRNLLDEMKAKGYKVCSSLEETLNTKDERVFAVLEEGQLPLANDRGDLFQKACEKALDVLSKNKNGFFAMIEGSRIDDCGHWNDLPGLVAEIGDFDRTVGQVLEWAQKNGKTLVVILSDHETGAFTIIGGDISNGEVTGNFANKEHSGILVPVYAYGPQSNQFTGIMENTDIFKKIKSILNL